MAVSSLVQASGISASDLVTEPEWTLIGATTASAATMTISSIPATYRSLRLYIAVYNDSSGNYRLRLNNNTTNFYSSFGWGNAGTSISSAQYNLQDGFYLGAAGAGSGFIAVVDIFNYASSSTTAKFAKGFSVGSGASMGAYSIDGQLVQTTGAAITSVELVHSSGGTIHNNGYGLRVYGTK